MRPDPDQSDVEDEVDSIVGKTITGIYSFRLEGQDGMAFYLSDGRFLWFNDDRFCICHTPKYRAN